MPTFVDTSGFFAYLCASDQDHGRVAEAMLALARDQDRLVTSSYVVSETMGLLQRRIGFPAVRTFVDNVLPVVTVLWIGSREHSAGWQLMVANPRRLLTIVDATGIVLMHQEGIRFSLAHELGHHFLHRDVYSGILPGVRNDSAEGHHAREAQMG